MHNSVVKKHISFMFSAVSIWLDFSFCEDIVHTILWEYCTYHSLRIFYIPFSEDIIHTILWGYRTYHSLRISYIPFSEDIVHTILSESDNSNNLFLPISMSHRRPIAKAAFIPRPVSDRKHITITWLPLLSFDIVKVYYEQPSYWKFHYVPAGTLYFTLKF